MSLNDIAILDESNIKPSETRTSTATATVIDDCIHNKSYKYFFIFASTVLLTVPLTAITVIKVEGFQYTTATLIANILLCLVYIISLSALGFIGQQRYYDSLNELPRNSRRNSSRYSTGTVSTSCQFMRSESYIEELENDQAHTLVHTLVAMLGFGNSVFNMTKFGNQLILLLTETKAAHVKPTNSYVIVSMVENILKCFQELCILFLIIYQKDFKNILKCIFVRLFIFCLALSSLVQWVYIILDEVHSEMENQKPIRLLNGTQVASFYKSQRFLYPLAIEYHISAFIELLVIALVSNPTSRVYEFLIKIFKAKKQDNETIIENREIQIIQQQYLHSKQITHRNSIYKIRKHLNKHIFSKHLCSFVLIILSIIIVTISLVIVFFQDINYNPSNQLLVSQISEYCEIILLIASLVYTVFLLLFIMHFTKDSVDITEKIELTIDLFFIVFSNIFLICFCLITLYSSIKSFSLLNSDGDMPFTNNLRIATLIASVLPILESVLQTFVIFLCTLGYRCKKIYIDHEFIKIYALLNFAMWLFDTFSAKRLQTNFIHIFVYGLAKWESLGVVFIPLTIFYRFHTCNLLIKINAKNIKFN